LHQCPPSLFHNTTMTIIVVAKSSEGLVLAADTKVVETDRGTQKETRHTVRKIISFSTPHNFVGVTICGDAMGVQSIQRYFKEFENQLPHRRLRLAKYAEELDVFMTDKWLRDRKPRPETMSIPGLLGFLVCGFDENEGYGRIYEVLIPSDSENPNPIEVNSGNESGFYYRGASSFANRLILGCSRDLPRVISYEINKQLKLELDIDGLNSLTDIIQNAADSFRIPAPDTMSLDDAKNIATMLVQMTIDFEKLPTMSQETSCDYPIDVCSITAAEGVKWYPRICGYKELISPSC